ncbi:carbohydrate ABC transporter permease [Muricomes sp. OA1]|uniref:Carbohydrate ABC transporter permease n=1 Tax=Hungatella hathewayi TaxID=154046 RepID=A0A3E2WCR1_9FIRM|nr:MULTISPECIES: carbohydrate ABC transporter permease [Clostridia]MCH1973158.1 carbohydrate ABC transporter permease [Muricomes sp. OA1]MRM91342.1 carbohydrate ABC transporter permease [Faecalicatena contorta]RGC22943.1 carbohydrate ABC transporter permease [Hungatella hathewayi]GKH31939.1 sugar ABC transporter permease [Faecalicatena contorta]
MKRKKGYWLFMVLFLIFTIGPFVWAFLISVTPEYGMFGRSANLLPEHITWENYRNLLLGTGQQGQLFYTGMLNSLKAVGVTLLLGMPAALSSAYALSRMEFKGRSLIKNMLLITMVIPVMATIIPIYKIFADHQLLDNMFWLSVIYVSALLPVTTWLISNYFATIPKELEEAALVDGCGRMRAFLRIILPASEPVIVSAALILFLNTWSQFQIPLILASSLATKPIAVVTSEFMTKDAVQYGITAAAGICAVVPPAVLALGMKRFLVAGIMGGAVKE